MVEMGMTQRACGAMRLGLIGLTAVALLASGIAVRAQDTAAGVAQPKMMPKDADPDWEVVTVKPSDPNDNGHQRIRFHGQHVMLLDHTVEDILLIGHGVQKSQLAGEPNWVKTERWDVDGISDIEGQPSMQQLQEMMQELLAERFGLKLHHERRVMPVFALTVARDGPKLALNSSDPNGWMDQQNNMSNGRDVEALKNTSMSDLALILQFRVDRPVVDETGLKGRYDFKLQWTTDEARDPAPDAPPGLFTAIQEQIGLKLEPAKAPADVLVIDQVERPEAN